MPRSRHSAAEPRAGRTPVPGRSLVRARLAPFLFVVLWLTTALRAEVLSYRGTLSLEWGRVEFVENGTPVSEDSWFTLTPPTFADSALPAPLATQLRECFEVAAATAHGAKVWRIHPNLSSDLRTRALAMGCVQAGGVELALTNSPPAPEPPNAGATMEWPFRLRCEPVTIPPLQTQPPLELILLIDEIPAGEAWEIPLATAIAVAATDTGSILATAELERVRSCAKWARLFLVARATLHEGGPAPTIRATPSPEHFARPLAYGLRVLLAAAEALGPDRAFTDDHGTALRRAIEPGGAAAFAGSHRWFPEPDLSRNELCVTAAETDTAPTELVRVSHPTTGAAFTVARVLPRDEWVVRIGPFRRIAAPTAHVAFVAGKAQTHPVAELPTVLADRPDELRRYETAIAALDQQLAAAVAAGATAEFFWLPTVARQHAESVRAIERLRFVANTTATFRDNRIEYAATFAPAPVSAKLGATYNPEHQLGANAEASWSGLLRAGDTFTLTATVANHAADGSLRYALPLGRSDDRKTTHAFELAAEAGQDDRFRLGGLSAEPFHHRVESAALEHVLTRQFPHWALTLRHAVIVESHRLTAPGSAAPLREHGLVLRQKQEWRRRPATARDGPVVWDHTVHTTIEYGPRSGWDRAFGRFDLGATTTVAFGGANRDAMYVRLLASTGCATGTPPAALAFRCGDADRFFGLEPGEFSGRSYVHSRLEYGYSLARPLGRLFTDSAGAPAIPEALAGLHLVAVAEGGRLATARGYHVWRADAESLSSFGLLLEKASPDGTGLRLGYAWSPEGRRDRGRFFTSLRFSF